MITIAITNEAKEHILESCNDKPSVMVGIIQQRSGWCNYNELSVLTGEPKEKSAFDIYEVDGINVYLQKQMRIPKDRVEIYMKNLVFKKQIFAKGIKYTGL